MPLMVSRAIDGMSTYADVVISPATMHRPVVTMVSHATRAAGSLARIASSTESEIWSAILSGWPSVTDSEVKVQLVMVSLLLLCGGSSWARRGSTAGRAFLDDEVEERSCDQPLVREPDLRLPARTSEDEHRVGVVLEPHPGSRDVVG